MDKIELARSSNTPIEVLEKLANDGEYSVRCIVAQNPNITVEVLEKLSNDEDCDVRCEVAYNPIIPKYIKTHLRYKNYLKCYEQD